MFERREQDRLLCADLVEVRWVTDGRPHHKIANLEDIGPGGLCLLLEDELPPGLEIRVALQAGDWVGIVRHSTPTHGGFLAGVGFAEEAAWTPDCFRPAHLLDLTER